MSITPSTALSARILSVRRTLAAAALWLVAVAALAQTADKVQTADKAGAVALKTNLLYDLALVTNAGIEVSLGHRWTVAADGHFTWLSKNSRHRYWQSYGGYVTLRRYFGKRSMVNGQCSAFSGHHLGIYGLALTYDVEWGGEGYQANRLGFGGGVEYGYSLPISRYFDLDFSLGVGFQGGEYEVYEPMGNRYVWRATRQRQWWGPTKAEVTLKWKL